MFACCSLQSDGDIKRSTGRHCSAHPRHGDARDIVKSDVRGWFGNKHEALVKTKKKAFIGFDGAFHARLLVMTDKCLGRRHYLLASQPAKHLCDHGMHWSTVALLYFTVVFSL